MLLSIYAELMDSQSEEMHGWEGSPELIIDELFLSSVKEQRVWWQMQNEAGCSVDI